MQPMPAGEEQVSPGETVLPEREQTETLALVLRPRLEWRAVGPALFALAFLALAVGRLKGVPVAFVLVAVGVLFLPALWERVEVGEHTIRRRQWRGGTTTISLDRVDALRLRRIPFTAIQGLRRGYKIGRFWSVPLTLRLLTPEAVVLELRCGWWGGWRDLARYIVARPDIDLDGRTKGRLDRYVGPLPITASPQP